MTECRYRCQSFCSCGGGGAAGVVRLFIRIVSRLDSERSTGMRVTSPFGPAISGSSLGSMQTVVTQARCRSLDPLISSRAQNERTKPTASTALRPVRQQASRLVRFVLRRLRHRTGTLDPSTEGAMDGGTA